MNITPNASYSSTASQNSYYSPTSGDSNTFTMNNGKNAATANPATPTDNKRTDKTPAEQKLESNQEYKKELQKKETRDKELDELFDSQQKRKEEIHKQVQETLTDNGFYQLGAQNGIALTKENMDETMKSLFNKGFQIDSNEDKMTLTSKVHQMKMEISKNAYDKYVEAVYGQLNTATDNISKSKSDPTTIKTGIYSPPASMVKPILTTVGTTPGAIPSTGNASIPASEVPKPTPAPTSTPASEPVATTPTPTPAPTNTPASEPVATTP
ncbi:hypothetical protein ACFSGI_16710, partial [Paenibacillus nicotianae]